MRQRFPNEDACLEHIMAVRFGGSRFDCLKCGTVGATFHKLAKRRTYVCSASAWWANSSKRSVARAAAKVSRAIASRIDRIFGFR
jgi:transposase